MNGWWLSLPPCGKRGHGCLLLRFLICFKIKKKRRNYSPNLYNIELWTWGRTRALKFGIEFFFIYIEYLPLICIFCIVQSKSNFIFRIKIKRSNSAYVKQFPLILTPSPVHPPCDSWSIIHIDNVNSFIYLSIL